MPSIDGGRIIVTLEGRDTNLSTLLTRIESQMQRGVSSARNYDTTIQQISASQARNEAATLGYAQSLARGAAATGDFAGAQRILGGALTQVTPNTTAASNAINQLQRTIDQASAKQKEANSVFSNAALGFNRLIGAYFAVSTAASAFGAAIEAGNELEKQQVALRSLSGTQEKYIENLAAAKAQQDKFGGSLADNVESLSGFANLSNRTGIEITKLANLARALATIDPVQGFKGAAIALKEFFSGDITSLARRFEIPRDALNEIKKIADEGERFAALEAKLAEFGITQELVAAQARTTAVEYAKLSGAATDAFAAVGQSLGTVLLPAAQKLTAILKEVATNLPQLLAIDDKSNAFVNALFSASDSLDLYNEKIRTANDQLGIFGGLFIGQFEEMTQTQFDFAKGALAAGLAIDTIKVAIDGLRQGFADLDSVFRQFPGLIQGTAEEIEIFKDAALAMASTGPDGAAAAQAIVNAVVGGKEDVSDATFRMQSFTTAIIENTIKQNELANQTTNTNAAIAEEVSALTSAATEAINAAVASDELKQRQESIYNAALAAAAGMAGSGDAAIAMANKFGIAISEADALIERLRNLGIAQQLAGAKTKAESNFASINALAGRAVDLNAFREAQKSLDGLNKAQRDLAFSTKDSAGQLAFLRGELSKLNPGTETYIRKQIEVNAAEEKLENERKRRAKSGTKNPKLTANEKLNNQLLVAEDKFNNQMEDLERKHQSNLVDIIEEFGKKQLEAERANETGKRRSRFDFYTSLSKSSLSPIDKQAFAAAYEEAFAEAQRIAQEGKASLAKEFLDLRQSQIQEMQELAQEAQEIRDDKDLGKGEKQARLAELDARKRLLEEAHQEELKQLRESGDKIQNEFQDRIAEENQAYSDQAAKIAETAERAADAKIAASERAKIKVNEENKAYAEQLRLLDGIKTKSGGNSPGTVPSTTSQSVAITTPVPIDTTTPIPVQPPEALTVKQFEMFIVRDQGVIDTINDQTSRLEGRLNELIGTVNTMHTGLGSRIDSVRSAIGTIKLARP